MNDVARCPAISWRTTSRNKKSNVDPLIADMPLLSPGLMKDHDECDFRNLLSASF